MTEQTETEFWAQERARDAAERGRQADPSACGTCKAAVAAGGQVVHDECARRATLLPAPDAPYDELIIGMTEEQVRALPARFHIPVFMESSTPKLWVCAVCWGDGWSTQWPCKTAVEQGLRVFTAEDYAETAAKRQAAELAAYRALALGDLDGRASAACGNPEHPTWLRKPDDPRGCPWCRIAELERDVDGLHASRAYWRDRYRAESRTTWSTEVPPGGEICADCGEPVESEPCAEHNPAALVEHLRAELAKYVGHEPTVAEEMAYLSSCLDAVHELCDATEKQGIASGGVFTVEAVRATASGERGAATVRPAIGWAFALDPAEQHALLSELATALLGYWHSDPDTDVLARVETALREQRAQADGRDIDANQLPDLAALRQAMRVRDAQLARLRTEMTGGAR